MNQQRKSGTAAAATLAGACSGAISAMTLQPLDVLTTRIIQQPVGKLKTLEQSRISFAFNSVVSARGLSGLWSGVIPATVRVAGGAAVYFSVLSVIFPTASHASKLSSTESTPWLGAVMAGIIARASATVIMSPVTLLKTRAEAGLNVGGSNFAGNMVSSWRNIVSAEGWTALFKGLVPVLIRDLPYSAGTLAFYIHSKKLLLQWHARTSQIVDEEHIPYWIDFAAGCIGGGVSTMLTHPGEVLKVKHQLNQKRGFLRLSESIRMIYTEEGIQGFFKGYMPRILRRSLSNSLSWGLYGFFLQILTSH
jgi:solute carrier family 25 protein 38